MNSKEYISKDLASWLKESGCEVPHTHAWDNYWRGDDDFELHPRLPNGKTVPANYKECRAYSWFDILVTYAEEFWGESLLEEHEPICMHPAADVLACLMEGNQEAAEKIVMEHSVFANPKTK